MPQGLERAYERNWTDILQYPHGTQARALAILPWALHAVRPLTVREITDALLGAADGNNMNDEDDYDDDND